MTFSSPIVISSGGKEQLIVWTQQAVNSLDPVDGKDLLASARSAAPASTWSPLRVYRDGLLLVGGTMLRLDPDKPAATAAVAGLRRAVPEGPEQHFQPAPARASYLVFGQIDRGIDLPGGEDRQAGLGIDRR